VASTGSSALELAACSGYRHPVTGRALEASMALMDIAKAEFGRGLRKSAVLMGRPKQAARTVKVGQAAQKTTAE
jgi:hypothetical protein